MKVNLIVQGQPLFLSPDGLVPRTRLQDDWEGDPNDLGGGHGPWRQDQEAQGGGGGVSPALPDHRRRHGQEQDWGYLAQYSILKEMLAGLRAIAEDDSTSKDS